MAVKLSPEYCPQQIPPRVNVREGQSSGWTIFQRAIFRLPFGKLFLKFTDLVEGLYKIQSAVCRCFSILPGKYLCWILFLIKLQVFSCECYKILKNSFF